MSKWWKQFGIEARTLLALLRGAPLVSPHSFGGCATLAHRLPSGTLATHRVYRGRSDAEDDGYVTLANRLLSGVYYAPEGQLDDSPG